MIKGIFDKRFYRKDDKVCEHLTFSSGLNILRFTVIENGQERYYNSNIPKDFYEEWVEVDKNMFRYFIDKQNIRLNGRVGNE